MKEEAFYLPSDSYFLSDNKSPDDILEDKNFLSSEAKPENIFRHPVKDTSETQLSTLILEFPFTLDSYQLLHVKNKEDSELGGSDCKIFLGNLEKIRFDEPILKLTFFSKDRKSPLNLKDYPNEMNSLIINFGIEFMSVYQNKLFIQCENENMTNEAYTSLQKSSTLFDLLYDEERSINSLDEQNKGINFGLNSDKKSNNNENTFYEGILSSNKKEKNEELFNKFDLPNLNNKKINENNLKYEENKKFDIFSNLDQKNIWNSKQTIPQINKNNNENNNKNQNIPLQNQNNSPIMEESNIKKSFSNKNPQVIFPPKIFPPLIFPINNLPKIPPNPSLMMQIPKINPFLLQTALLMQNLIKLQQLNLKPNENKDKKNILINNIINFNGKNENSKNNHNNIETDNYLTSNNINKESSTNSKTSSTSSKESSPSANNENKNDNNNFSILNNNYPLFNGFNLKTPNNNLQNKGNYNSNIGKDLLNDLKIDDKNNNNNTKNINNNIENKNEQEINNSNLEEIVLNKKYKEYIPKKKLNNEKEKEKEKDVKFHTNSTRDYQFKYVSRYIVQIENEKNFPVTKMIIGNNGKLLRQILLENCINLGDHTTKIRLRGKGSGYKEGPKNEESKDPMELCISSLNMLSYMRCSQAIENLLLNVYYQYYLYQCNNASSENNNNINKDNINNKKEIKDKNGCPIVMKKILKYQYVVNRYNTLVKEEKRRKKEEELKNSNQNNNTYNDNNKNCNHA